MAWTAPRTWNPLDLVDATMMNTHVRDNLTFLGGSSGVGASLHFTAPVVDSGGLTISGNGSLVFGTGSGSAIDSSAITGNMAIQGPSANILFRNQANSITTFQITNAGAIVVPVGPVQLNGGFLDFSAQANATVLSGSSNFILRDSGNANTNFSVTGAGAMFCRSTLQIGSRGAFASGDKYLIVDSSGNVHVSALGPAS